jgi:hypothetical protein
MTLTTEELLDSLGALYTEEFGDWVLSVHKILTEPTSTSASIHPEDWDKTRHGEPFGGFQAVGSTVDQAAHNAAALAHAVLIQRLPFEPGVPWTNFGDNAALKKIIAALDEEKEFK